MAYTFKLSDSSVNDYGTRVITSGINLDRFKSNPIMLWMHRRDDGGWLEAEAPLPIGRWENIRIEGDDLIADAVFDEADEFALKIQSKVDQKILNTASVGLSIIELSEDPAIMLQGQTRATISKSELVEASIVDIPGNKNAVRLYNKGAALKLSLPDMQTSLPEINQNPINTMKKITLLSLAAIAAFFGKQTSEEMEFSQEDAKKVNDELQQRADNIVTLTTERDAANAERETLITQLAESTTLKGTVDTALATATSRITELEAENTQLKSNAGAPPATAVTEADAEETSGKVKLAANSEDFMSNLENVKKAYM